LSPWHQQQIIKYIDNVSIMTPAEGDQS